jgi:methionyl-tRNA formyltransferase
LVKIGFIGCHQISQYCLKKICELSQINNDSISIVINYPPEKSSRYSAYASFDDLQKQYNFPIYFFSDVSEPHVISLLKNSNLDILFIIGWHRIVPSSVLETAPIKLGIHSSYLPKDRGSSPINWQIIRGDNQGGVTLFHLTIGVDSGNIVDKEKFPISINDNVRDVYVKATVTSINLLENNWNDIHHLKPKSIPQDESTHTLNNVRRPSDGLIHWDNPSLECYNLIRGLTHPYPGAFTFWNEKKIFIWESKLSDFSSKYPGTIIQADDKIVISTGKNCLEILSLQIENEPILSAKDFVNSHNLSMDEIFTSS